MASVVRSASKVLIHFKYTSGYLLLVDIIIAFRINQLINSFYIIIAEVMYAVA